MEENENRFQDTSFETGLETSITEEKAMPTQSKKSSETLICPECGRTDFKDLRGLGSHRHASHGVAGKAASTVAYRKRQEKLKSAGSATVAKKNHHKNVATEVSTPGEVALVAPKQPKIPTVSPAMLGYGMGRVESLAAEIARENLLPEKEFVRLVVINLAEMLNR